NALIPPATTLSRCPGSLVEYATPSPSAPRGSITARRMRPACACSRWMAASVPAAPPPRIAKSSGTPWVPGSGSKVCMAAPVEGRHDTAASRCIPTAPREGMHGQAWRALTSPPVHFTPAEEPVQGSDSVHSPSPVKGTPSMAKILVLYHSAYGHVETMANAMAEGARSAGATVDIKRVPELVPEEVARNAGYKLDQPAPRSEER